MASTYLQKNTVTATDAQKFTYSGWLKRAGGINNASAQDIFYIGYLDINNRLYFSFAGGDTIFMVGKTGGSIVLVVYIFLVRNANACNSYSCLGLRSPQWRDRRRGL